MFLSSIFNITKNIIKNRFNLPVSSSFVTYIVTWRCNAKCVMCDIWKKAGGYELNLEEIERIFSQLKKLDAVRLTGGEPFLRTDLHHIANAIQKYSSPQVIHVTTNGLLKKQTIEFVQKVNCPQKISIKVSIDYPDKRHDQARGFEGAFDIAMDTLHSIDRLREKYGFQLGVNQILFNRDSLKDYEKLKKSLEGYDIPIYLFYCHGKVPLYKPEGYVANSKDITQIPSTFLDFTGDDINQFIKTVEDSIRQMKYWPERFLKRYWLYGLKNRLLFNQKKPRPKCAALRSHLRILPNGDVPICIFNSTVVGNLREDSVRKIWSNIDRHREWVDSCVGCWFDCELYPNAVYSGDIIKYLLRLIR